MKALRICVETKVEVKVHHCRPRTWYNKGENVQVNYVKTILSFVVGEYSRQSSRQLGENSQVKRVAQTRLYK